ncbi:hypothetical protein GGR57DRAFT_501213 [Xylariaceae sp. FL1272]|nr:hypothetical protein GGR57DRAFT_501213 [Xylariaceae sp. FL1272]
MTERSHILEAQSHSIDCPKQILTPIRVLCDPDQTVSDMLVAISVYDDAMHSIEHIGLHNIRCTDEYGSAACQFDTILCVTSCDRAYAPSPVGLHQTIKEPDGLASFTDRALLLTCQMSGDTALLIADYDQKIVDKVQIARILRQFGSLVQQFQSCDVDPPLEQLDFITQEDREEISRWNLESPRVEFDLIHDLFTTKAAAVPGKVAVSAWDGDLTYTELEDGSSRLAGHIQSLGLSQGQAVILF